VATGAPTQAIADAAKYIGADLIVVGRSEATDAESSHPLMEAVRGASCPVLIVHPSGRAAVA
jgi:nucleotide-binding universal stress UspA family protein